MTLIYNDNQSAGNSAKPPVTLRMLLPLWNFPCTPLLTELLPLLSVGFPDSSVSKESSFSAGDQGSIPDQEDSLEKETATHSSILAWRIPWTEEPGRLQSMGSQRVGQTERLSLHFHLSELRAELLLRLYTPSQPWQGRKLCQMQDEE